MSGAAIRFDAQVSVFDPRDPASPCYACVFPPGQAFEETACATLGVFAFMGTWTDLIWPLLIARSAEIEAQEKTTREIAEQNASTSEQVSAVVQQHRAVVQPLLRLVRAVRDPAQRLADAGLGAGLERVHVPGHGAAPARLGHRAAAVVRRQPADALAAAPGSARRARPVVREQASLDDDRARHRVVRVDVGAGSVDERLGAYGETAIAAHVPLRM